MSGAVAGRGRRSIRLISSTVNTARGWRSRARRLAQGRYTTPRAVERARAAAACAELLGVPVGIVTGVREVPA